VSNFVALQSIATSSAQNDGGLFELNFRDERYLPFEGTGAISRWRIELPKSDNAFDLQTISEPILHVRYTAREGGDVLRKAARANLSDLAAAGGPSQVRLFSLRHEYPNDWYRFVTPVDPNSLTQTLTLDLPMERFPFRFRSWQMQITDVELIMPIKDFTDDSGTVVKVLKDYRPKPLNVTLSFQDSTGATSASTSQKLTSTSILEGTPYLHWGNPALAPQTLPSRFLLEVQETDVLQLAPSLRTHVPPVTGKNRIKTDMLEDLILLLHFTANPI
jgi:hypothetical protein